MSDYRAKLQKAKEIAEANQHQPKVLRRTPDGEAEFPFKSAFYRAMLPSLLAAGDELLPALNSPDARTRSRAEAGIDAITRQIKQLENPEK